jgi:hypothetical protein
VPDSKPGCEASGRASCVCSARLLVILVAEERYRLFATTACSLVSATFISIKVGVRLQFEPNRATERRT